jgi:hypothetical protein
MIPAPNPRRLQRHLRYLCFLAAGLGLGYIAWRFDTQTLPAGGCSPLMRYAPGNRLLVDRRPPRLEVGDALLFRAEGQLLLGAVARVRPDGAPPDGVDAVWIAGDNPQCPAHGSAELGWIDAHAVQGRVVMVWPW